MATTEKREIIQRLFDSFRSGDRPVVESLFTADFQFTSPYDDHIDRRAFFERCWPLHETIAGHDIQLILTDGDDAVVHYDGRNKSGATFRNVERFHFDGDLIRSIEVFFGLPSDGVAQSPEAAIKTVLEQRQEALRVKDARLVAAKHAPSPVVFSLAPPLVTHDESAAALNHWFSGWDGDIDWETRDPQIAVSGDVAFVTALEHMGGQKRDGEDVDMWFRLTLGLRKVDGEWKIAHEHQSVPFYMDGSLRAAVDLRPDGTAHIASMRRGEPTSDSPMPFS